MKNIFVGMMIAVALFTAPMAQAQVATSSDPVVQSQLNSLRQELIKLLLQLVQELQTQLDAQLKADAKRDDEITSIRNKVDQQSQPVVQVDSSEDKIADARHKVGAITATAIVEEEDGSYSVSFSLTNYLDIDTASFSANMKPAEIEDGGCGTKIAGSEYTVCAQYATYSITATSSPLIITTSVNGQEKDLEIDANSSIQRVTWPTP